MDTLNTYVQIVEQVLTKYVEVHYNQGDIQNLAIFDRAGGHFMVMSLGWQGVRRIHGCLVHIDIEDGKVWIQRDGTEHGIANSLVAAGIPAEQIVLGFYTPATRQHTAFAHA